MIDFALTDEEQLLQRTAREFAERKLRPRIREHERSGVPPELVAEARELGLDAADQALGPLAQALVLEELGAADVGASLALDPAGPARYPLRRLGGKVAPCERLALWADRSNAWRLEDDGGQRRLTGHAPWCPGRDISSVVAILPGGVAVVDVTEADELPARASTGEQAPRRDAPRIGPPATGGSSHGTANPRVHLGGAGDREARLAEVEELRAAVPCGTARGASPQRFRGGANPPMRSASGAREGCSTQVDSGVRVSPVRSLALDAVELRLERAPVREWLPGDTALALAEVQLYAASLLVGLCRAAYEYAARYTLERVTFGRLLAHHQAVAFMVVEMAMAADAARLASWRACMEIADSTPAARWAAAAALAEASESALLLTNRAVQLLGGHGYLKDHPVEKWMREARALTLAWGGPAALAEVLADAVELGWEAP
ncbi:MAG: acyl-CoA/acyl-ACP dehydrogenase [Myxococcales bacterium]|nr:acyl-CoA/acyl-ACP dehydrogenase [Myxococcales bacterium]